MHFWRAGVTQKLHYSNNIIHKQLMLQQNVTERVQALLSEHLHNVILTQFIVRTYVYAIIDCVHLLVQFHVQCVHTHYRSPHFLLGLLVLVNSCSYIEPIKTGHTLHAHTIICTANANVQCIS